MEHPRLPGLLSAAEWEAAFAPYDEATYAAALQWLTADDIVLDIGAGDLRFARRAAQRVRRIIAIEQRAELIPADLPANVQAICGDARQLPFPSGVTVGVLLMRHCQHFTLYADKLRAAGARQLITNARWKMGVERLDLLAPRLPFTAAQSHWYACACGAVGFQPGPLQSLTAHTLEQVIEVADCPQCRPTV